MSAFLLQAHMCGEKQVRISTLISDQSQQYQHLTLPKSRKHSIKSEPYNKLLHNMKLHAQPGRDKNEETIMQARHKNISLFTETKYRDTKQITKPSTKNSSYQAKGFTLLELLVATSIAIILMAIGVPSFNSFIRDSTLRSETNTLSSSFSLSRSEAIRRGENINITAISGSTNWSNGWRIWVDSNNNNSFDANNDAVIRVFDATTSNISSTQSTLSFNHDGSLVLPANSTSINFDVKPKQNCQTNEQRHLSIEASGRIDFSLTTCS